MKKWICTICGYVYDPAVGDSGHGLIMADRELGTRSAPAESEE